MKTEQDWQAEEDLYALQRAEEIKKDKARMEAAKVMAEKKLSELKAITNTPETTNKPPAQKKNSKFNFDGIS